MKKKCLLLALICCSAVNFSRAADFIWYVGRQPVTYAMAENVSPVVHTALQMWMDDLRQVTGLLPQQSRNARSATVRILQLDQYSGKDLAGLGLPLDKLKARKEAFYIAVKNNQLIIAGSDRRGTAYGLLELSRLAGVSPWIWWGDVVPERKQRLSLPADFQSFQSPSVAYRGIFLNDEDFSLQPWSWKHFDPQQKSGMISAKTYKQIFKLLLRLRANAIWPGMHGISVPFYLVPGAKEAADSCGIVMGTSHCEPLMSNANGEWLDEQRGAYNYISNKSSVLNFWQQRLDSVRHYENIFTMGMRGKHDGSMQGVKTMKEKTAALQQVIYDQRKMLQQIVNPDLTALPQQFVPYKEVLDIYERGLDVPEDIMLTWCDDNYGYMKRLSDSAQQKRSGGSGVYYHFSYWGRPHDYLWLTTTQPGLIYQEMKTAYAHNARRLWIVNIHDIKPAAYQLELFMDMAWNIQSIDEVSGVAGHLKNWLQNNFGAQAGGKLFPAMREYYRLTTIRKPEFMGWNQVELDKKKYRRGMSPVQPTEFSFTSFNNEADRYLNDYENIKQQILEVEKLLPENRRDAYFAAIKYPVFAAAAMAEKILESQRTRAIASGGYDEKRWKRDDQLLRASARSMDAYYRIRELTAYYNDSLAGGKWKYSMCYNPRDLYVFDSPALPVAVTPKEMTGLLKSEKPDKYPSVPIQSDGSFIARNAAAFSHASVQVYPVKMLGHSMNAVPLPKGATLRYEFEAPAAGDVVLRTALIPTHPSDKGDIRFSVQLDDAPPQIISFREKGRSETWKLNVLRGQAVKNSQLHLSAGKHTLRFTALDDHVTIDQWMIDYVADRKFYVFPVDPDY
ncbi:glycosyl hydrolase 115 family protein [Niabella terrae]